MNCCNKIIIPLCIVSTARILLPIATHKWLHQAFLFVEHKVLRKNHIKIITSLSHVILCPVYH